VFLDLRDFSDGHELGTAVAGHGGWVFVGDPKALGERGRAYVFFNPGGGDIAVVP